MEKIGASIDEQKSKQNIWILLGGEEDEDSLTTTRRQLRVTDSRTGENHVYAPVIYQSCMRPEEISVYEMKVTKKTEHQWEIETHYETCLLEVRGKKIEVSDWKAEIHKVDCRKCENCGRCGW